jgi:hypothetical protein
MSKVNQESSSPVLLRKQTCTHLNIFADQSATHALYVLLSLVELVNITLFSLPPPTTLPCCYIFHFNSELKHLHHRSLSVSEPKSLQLELSAAGPFLAHKFQQTNPPDHHHTTRRSEDASSQAQILQVQVLVVAAANGTRRISFSSLHQLAS